MAFVTEAYYSNTFFGIPVQDDSFAQYNAWAERSVSAATCYRVNEENFQQLPQWMQTAYQNAICAQISYYAEDGISTAIDGGSGDSFTVGKVSITKGGGKDGSSVGASMICTAARSFLEQTGLMNPQVDVFDRWWP